MLNFSKTDAFGLVAAAASCARRVQDPNRTENRRTIRTLVVEAAKHCFKSSRQRLRDVPALWLEGLQGSFVSCSPVPFIVAAHERRRDLTNRNAVGFIRQPAHQSTKCLPAASCRWPLKEQSLWASFSWLANDRPDNPNYTHTAKQLALCAEDAEAVLHNFRPVSLVVSFPFGS